MALRDLVKHFMILGLLQRLRIYEYFNSVSVDYRIQVTGIFARKSLSQKSTL